MNDGRASASTVTPGVLYHDAQYANAWPCRTYGCEQRLVVPGANGGIAHAHLTFGNGRVMRCSAEGHALPGLCKSPRGLGGGGTAEILVYVADPHAHYRHAVAQGATIVLPLEDKPFAGRGYRCRNPQNHAWAN